VLDVGIDGANRASISPSPVGTIVFCGDGPELE
jgi:hypothetical protein